jgi:hypothetical protein
MTNARCYAVIARLWAAVSSIAWTSIRISRLSPTARPPVASTWLNVMPKVEDAMRRAGVRRVSGGSRLRSELPGIVGPRGDRRAWAARAVDGADRRSHPYFGHLAQQRYDQRTADELSSGAPERSRTSDRRLRRYPIACQMPIDSRALACILAKGRRSSCSGSIQANRCSRLSRINFASRKADAQASSRSKPRHFTAEHVPRQRGV